MNRTPDGTTFLAYAYRIRPTGSSSGRLGSCEVCGEYCAEVHIQAEGEQYLLDGEDAPFIAHRETSFGHEACLLGRRRTPVVPYPQKR